MRAQDEEEETEDDCFGDGKTDREGLLGICESSDGGSFVKLLGVNLVVLLQQLAGDGTEPTEGAEKLATNGKDFGKGVSR